MTEGKPTNLRKVSGDRRRDTGPSFLDKASSNFCSNFHKRFGRLEYLEKMYVISMEDIEIFHKNQRDI